MKKSLITLAVLIVAAFILIGLSGIKGGDYRTGEYTIEGQAVRLQISDYFGNELKTDLDADGDEDSVFIITQRPGGSGTFYYVVAALKTDNGYAGSDAYFLGDRIAPQTTELSKNPRHKQVIVVNYADRAPGEPMTATPSVGKSAYLKINPETRQWGVVEPNFEGESNIPREIVGTWVWKETLIESGKKVVPVKSGAFTITFAGNQVSGTTDCNSFFGGVAVKNKSLSFGPLAMTKKFCQDSQEREFITMIEDSNAYLINPSGELVLHLKNDSGSVVFTKK